MSDEDLSRALSAIAYAISNISKLDADLDEVIRAMPSGGFR